MTELMKNIGWNGKTALEMLEESEALLNKTGYYYGLEKLKMKEEEPIRYEKIFSRLRGGLVTARETCMNIAASPIIQEEGELCFVLYTPEGDSIAVSTGILVHVHTMSETIKYMIRNDYEEDPGIAPGDIFTNNDTVAGQIHNVDVSTIVPIFWEGELVGWSAAVTHEVDVGEQHAQTDTYDEGLVLPALKTGENDKIRRDYQFMCQRRVRNPIYWNLDERTRIAGCHLIRQAVYRVIEQEGIDTYKRFIHEIIEDGHRTFINKVKELLVPGTYRAPAFQAMLRADNPGIAPRARKDIMMHGPFELTIGGDGNLHLSFEGANEWGWHSNNCTPSGLQGAMWVLLTQTVIPNDQINDGAYLAISMNLPPGSWTNAPAEIAGTQFSWGWLFPSFTGMFRTLSRSFQARGFVEEVISGYSVGGLFRGTGVDYDGKALAFTNFEAAGGSGAGMIMDGLDYGATMFNPEGDMGDVETWEVMSPFLSLGRRVKPNTGGWGKFRGGSTFESLRMCWDIPLSEMGQPGRIRGSKTFFAGGLFGGYPNGSGYRRALHDTDILERARNEQPYPIREGSPDESQLTPLVKGRDIFDEHGSDMMEIFREGDICLHGGSAAPGLGDPLERAPDMVAEDLNGDYVTEHFAKSVYGAIASKDNNGKWVVDTEATARQRETMRQHRAQRSIPARQWLQTAREKVLNKDLIKPIREMYISSMHLNENWAKDYRQFWNLDENFTYEED